MKNKKLGDLYTFKCNEGVGYLQYLGKDSSQLFADIVRVFKGVYLDSMPMTLSALETAGIDYYALTLLAVGLKMKWCSIYSREKPIELPDIFFRSTPDYGCNAGEEPIRKTDRWNVWRPNQAKLKVNGLKGDHTKAYIGVISPISCFIERSNTGNFPGVYPEPITIEP
jgi:hypothetical protein